MQKKPIQTVLLFLLLFSAISTRAITLKKILSDTLTISFKVNGTPSCKANIESAIKANSSVINANWDASSKQITISYLSTGIRISDFYTILAQAGYDNAELRAKQGAYDTLAPECKYSRDPETE